MFHRGGDAHLDPELVSPSLSDALSGRNSQCFQSGLLRGYPKDFTSTPVRLCMWLASVIKASIARSLVLNTMHGLRCKRTDAKFSSTACLGVSERACGALFR